MKGLIGFTVAFLCFAVAFEYCMILDLRKELLKTEILLLKEKLNCKAPEVK